MIQERFRQAIAGGALLARGDRVLAAVSGGSDSVCLLLLLRDHAADGSITIVVAHVNHRLRGAAADEDQRFVEGLAARLGLRCVVLTPEDEDSLMLVRQGEEGARLVRRRLLLEAARREECSRIALGHTMDDQAETVLMRLVRGSARRGLSGMSALSPGGAIRFIRPMLGITREQAATLLRERGEEFRADASNDDRRFLRNDIRSRLMPLLVGLNPSIVRTLARNASLMAEEDAWLDLQAADWLAGRASTGPRGWSVPAADLAALPAVLARRAARLLLRKAGGDPRGSTSHAIEKILRAARAGASEVSHDLPGGMRVTREGLNLHVRRREAAEESGETSGALPAMAAMTLAIPGALDLPAAAGRMTARLVPRSEMAAFHPDTSCAAMDGGCLGGAVTVRTRRAGDTFHPLGAAGGRKLKEFLIDRKVPRALRDRVLLVEGPSGIAWVVGHRIGHGYRVTETTATVALLEWRPA